MHLSRRILAGLAGLAMLPLAVTLLTAMLAAMLGCEAGDAGASPCVIFGGDAGNLLSGLLALGGLAQVTIPLFMTVLAVWTCIEVAAWMRRRRRARRHSSQEMAA